MIITQTPLRIPLGGGGTDIPSYYKKHRGYWISAAINKYVYITLNDPLVNEYIIRYSKIERTKNINDIEHPLIREILKLLNIPAKVEISSMADIPGKTGLGSSGSFGVGLIRALQTFRKDHYDPKEIAELACHVEMNILKEPTGKQDQYIATYGGITEFEVDKDGNVIAKPLKISDETQIDLEENLLLFFTGFTRSAGSVFKQQDDATKRDDTAMIENLHRVKEIGLASKEALESGNLKKFGELMHDHWLFKKQRATNMSNPDIDKWYDVARQNGAIGGKLIGAGGGGFLLFYTTDSRKLRQAMKKEGLTEVRFAFDFEGSKVLLNV